MCGKQTHKKGQSLFGIQGQTLIFFSLLDKNPNYGKLVFLVNFTIFPKVGP